MNNQEIIEIINESWNWLGFSTNEIKMVNEFGNLIIKTEKDNYFRICPEELSCELIAKTEKEYINVINSQDSRDDWEMENLIEIAKYKLGKLGEKEKFCLKIPAVIGGEYSKQNIGKITFKELILCSGDLASQIKDMKDGQKIELKIKN